MHSVNSIGASQPNGASMPIPSEGFLGLREHWRSDFVAGLLVSLIALPLCLGIAVASGFPAFGGLITAIVGGLIVGPICGSRLTIKGPAAGLIAIAIASVETLGQGDLAAGYRYTLGVIVAASILQIIFAVCRLGRFGDFFPASVVHGMLAAIGVIIVSKQAHVLLGVKPIAHEPIGLLLEIPHSLVMMNPEVAFVGLTSLLAVGFSGVVLGRYSKYLPGPLLAVMIGLVLGLYFEIARPHEYTWYDKSYVLDPRYLVSLPARFFEGVTFPDFSKAFTLQALPFIMMFALIGSIESLLTVKAVDNIEPYARRSDLNRDLLALGLGNAVCGLIGGLPMISEVVRSYSNVSYGAKTRWANVAHGLCLLLFVLVLVDVLRHVPTAALAGVLCFTGYRLAAPAHFRERRLVGRGQLLIFCVTIVSTLVANDLLVGIVAGVIVKYGYLLVRGATLRSLFTTIPSSVVSERGGAQVVRLPTTCFFGNLIGFKALIEGLGSTPRLVLDFTDTRLIDHTFMREVRALERDRQRSSCETTLLGFDRLVPVSDSDTAVRRVVGA